MEKIEGPETLVTNQRKPTLGNNPQVISAYCNSGESLKSHMIKIYVKRNCSSFVDIIFGV
jgi:hypothetical protein